MAWNPETSSGALCTVSLGPINMVISRGGTNDTKAVRNLSRVVGAVEGPSGDGFGVSFPALGAPTTWDNNASTLTLAALASGILLIFGY